MGVSYGQRMLLKPQDRRSLFEIPTDENSLIRHYTLSSSDRFEIEIRPRAHNRLGSAVQLFLMRYPRRALLTNETLPRAILNYVAEQIEADPNSFEHYTKRQETKTNQVSYLLGYLGLLSPAAEDRRAALSAAIDTALTTDTGKPIATAIISSFRERRTLLPAANMIERIGLAARAIGQFFRASDRAAKRGDINLHYGNEPGTKFYSHLSDQYGYFGILPISPTESEAAYVLD